MQFTHTHTHTTPCVVANMIASKKKQAVRAKQLTTTFDESKASPGRHQQPLPGIQRGMVRIQWHFFSTSFFFGIFTFFLGGENFHHRSPAQQEGGRTFYAAATNELSRVSQVSVYLSFSVGGELQTASLGAAVLAREKPVARRCCLLCCAHFPNVFFNRCPSPPLPLRFPFSFPKKK